MNAAESQQDPFEFLSLESHREGQETTWELPAWNHTIAGGVAPLFVACEGRLFPIGTAFVVSSLKIVVTAWHNIAYAIENFHRLAPRARRSIGDPTTKNYNLNDLSLYVFLQGWNARTRKREYRLWSITRTATPRPSDLILGVLGAVDEDRDFKFLRLGLSPALPRIGTQLWSVGYCCFSYPPEGISIEAVAQGEFDWEANYSHHLKVCTGEVELLFTQRFAGAMLEGPCCRVPYDIPHGLSGGPTLNDRGFVCGVNSAGLEVSFGNGSLISLVYALMLTRLELKATNVRDRNHSILVNPSIRELIGLGKIWTDGSEQFLRYSSSDEGEAVHPMVHEEDAENVFESVSDYEDAHGG